MGRWSRIEDIYVRRTTSPAPAAPLGKASVDLRGDLLDRGSTVSSTQRHDGDHIGLTLLVHLSSPSSCGRGILVTMPIAQGSVDMLSSRQWMGCTRWRVD